MVRSDFVFYTYLHFLFDFFFSQTLHKLHLLSFILLFLLLSRLHRMKVLVLNLLTQWLKPHLWLLRHYFRIEQLLKSVLLLLSLKAKKSMRLTSPFYQTFNWDVLHVKNLSKEFGQIFFNHVNCHSCHTEEEIFGIIIILVVSVMSVSSGAFLRGLA